MLLDADSDRHDDATERVECIESVTKMILAKDHLVTHKFHLRWSRSSKLSPNESNAETKTENLKFCDLLFSYWTDGTPSI